MSLQETVLTITLNPAVDISTSVDAVVPDRKLYCAPPRIDPGGGGVNVARAIHRLGGSVAALVVAGGTAGGRLCDLLAAEGVPVRRFDVPGETRENFAVTDRATGAQFRFGLPGDPVAEVSADALIAEIGRAARPSALVVLSGSLAPGLAEDFPERIRAALAPDQSRLVVDTSNAALLRLMSQPVAPVFLLRLDRREAEQAAGRDLSDLAAHLGFAESLIARGVAEHIVSGRGAEGSLLVGAGIRLVCRPPRLQAVSKIGAGDAFVGALSLALARGAPLADGLRWGVAAAGATMASDGTALFTRADVEALLPQCRLETCPAQPHP